MDDGPGWSLLESIGYRGGEVFLVERHAERLLRSAAELGWKPPREIDGAGALRAAVAKHASEAAVIATQPDRLFMVRLVMNRDGACEVNHRLVPDWPRPIFSLPPAGDGVCGATYPSKRVAMSRVLTDTRAPEFRYKTTARDAYNQVKQESDAFDVLLVNQDGKVTEGCFTNVAFELLPAAGCGPAVWATPPASDGLLPGTLRQELVDSGQLVEHSVLAGDVAGGRVRRGGELCRIGRVVCFNSVRGVMLAALEGPGSPS
ncbi:putative aminodeoxychorismate lyase [Diplonema papillatum]|nr:putative aminodeoxychorismate lyase [Diplonema papillatum]